MTSLELNDKEKTVFLDWLQQREKAVQEEIEVLQTLRSKLESKEEVKKAASLNQTHHSETKAILATKEIDSSSWVDIIKNELRHFSHPVQSGEIVKRLLQKSFFAEKGKRFVTKAVTSKLWLLQERGEVIKTRENNRYVYSLKK